MNRQLSYVPALPFMLILWGIFFSFGCTKGGCIEGDCVNGRGTYRFPSGEVYTGQFNNGKYHGQGSYSHPDGRKYSGSFQNGKYNGKGTYTDKDGSVYTGIWKENDYLDPQGNEQASSKGITEQKPQATPGETAKSEPLKDHSPKNTAPDTKEAKDVADTYQAYRSAILNTDLNALKKLMSKEKVQELDGPQSAMILGMIKAIMPADVTIVSTNVGGDKATIKMKSEAKDGNTQGTATLVREEGKWKIFEENWSMSIGQEDTQDHGNNPPSPVHTRPDTPDRSVQRDAKGRNSTGDEKGRAIIVKDNKEETYFLKTEFFSDTRFDDPKHATIEFQVPAERNSNARRIVITLDATKIGTHYADGKIIQDQMFHNGKINIGEETPQGYTANFRFIADGGQIFSPKEGCTITVNSSYDGTETGMFSGEVTNCTVHSAGIDYHLSSVKFFMNGVPKR